MDVNWTYSDDLFITHTNIKLLYYTPKTNVMLYVNSISISKKKKER